MSSARIVDSACQSSGFLAVPHPRGGRSRFESFATHSFHCELQPSNATSTASFRSSTSVAGYQSCWSSSASTAAPTENFSVRGALAGDESFVGGIALDTRIVRFADVGDDDESFEVR